MTYSKHGFVFFALIFLSVITSIEFCILYVNHEQPLYYWDYGGYWGMFNDVGKLLQGRFVDLLTIFLQNVRTQDYNISPVVPLSPIYWFFGGGRGVYISAIAACYLIPTAIIAAKIAYKSIGKDGVGDLVPTYLIAATFTPFWAPTLRGLADIVGLIFLGLATLLLFHSNFLKKKPAQTAILLGILIWLPFLFRRWYAYSILAFFITAFSFGIFTLRREEKFWRQATLLCLWLGTTGLIAVICAVCFQYDLVVRAVTTSYADLYAAYQVSILTHFLTVLDRLGYYIGLLTITGAIALVLYKNIYGTFCLVSAIITFGLFIRTQRLGTQHFLPVAFWLFPAYISGVELLSRHVVLPKAGVRYMAVIASLTILYFTVVPLNSEGRIAAFFIPAERTPPLYINNFLEYKRLASDLKARLREHQHFAVFSSSTKLSDSMLVAIEPALKPYLSPAPHIAAVYHFPFEILRSEYAVAVTPPQTGMAPNSQLNITIPNDMLLNKQGFGAAFENDATYKLADGVVAYLFHRQRLVTAVEMRGLLDALEAQYPDWRSLYETSMEIPFAAREVKLGDVWGFFSVPSPNTIFLHPGATMPTIVDLPIAQSISRRPSYIQVSIPKSVLHSCPDADGVSLIVKSGPVQAWNGVITPGQNERIALPQIDGILELIVDKRSQPNCDHVYISFLFSP